MCNHTSMIESATAVPPCWRAVVTDDTTETGGRYTYYTRQVGPWVLEIFPADADGELWHGQVEMTDGSELSVYGDTMPAAASALEGAAALALVSMLMSLVGSSLPDPAWEAAVAIGEEECHA